MVSHSTAHNGRPKQEIPPMMSTAPRGEHLHKCGRASQVLSSRETRKDGRRHPLLWIGKARLFCAGRVASSRANWPACSPPSSSRHRLPKQRVARPMDSCDQATLDARHLRAAASSSSAAASSSACECGSLTHEIVSSGGLCGDQMSLAAALPRRRFTCGERGTVRAN